MADSKYTKAVARATGDAETPTMTMPVKDQEAFLTKDMTPDKVQAVLDDPALEFAPQIYKLDKHEMVTGVLEGNGPDAEFEHVDKATGVVDRSVVKTWILASPDGRKRISILSSVQLDRKLPPFQGGLVKIIRGEDINVDGGRRVTDYMVAGTKVTGKIRNWARPAAIDAASTDAKQLPAPASDGNSTGGHHHDPASAS